MSNTSSSNRLSLPRLGRLGRLSLPQPRRPPGLLRGRARLGVVPIGRPVLVLVLRGGPTEQPPQLAPGLLLLSRLLHSVSRHDRLRRG